MTTSDEGQQTARRERRAVLLRLDPAVHDALARWAADDLRSLNAHVELLLRDALREAGRAPRDAGPLPRRGRPRTSRPAPSTEPPGTAGTAGTADTAGTAGTPEPAVASGTTSTVGRATGADAGSDPGAEGTGHRPPR